MDECVNWEVGEELALATLIVDINHARLSG